MTVSRIFYFICRLFKTNIRSNHYFYRIYINLTIDFMRMISISKINKRNIFILFILSFVFELFMIVIFRIFFKSEGFLFNGGGSFIICVFSIIWMVFLWPCYVDGNYTIFKDPKANIDDLNYENKQK